jgi:hypothetical protein
MPRAPCLPLAPRRACRSLPAARAAAVLPFAACRSTERLGRHQAIGSGSQPAGHMSRSLPVAQVGGGQLLPLPPPAGMHSTSHVEDASSLGFSSPQPTAATPAAAPTMVNASTAGMRSGIARA